MRDALQYRNRISRMRQTAPCAALLLAAILVPAAITTQAAQAQIFDTLASFNYTNGSQPYFGTLVQATDELIRDNL